MSSPSDDPRDAATGQRAADGAVSRRGQRRLEREAERQEDLRREAEERKAALMESARRRLGDLGPAQPAPRPATAPMMPAPGEGLSAIERLRLAQGISAPAGRPLMGGSAQPPAPQEQPSYEAPPAAPAAPTPVPAPEPEPAPAPESAPEPVTAAATNPPQRAPGWRARRDVAPEAAPEPVRPPEPEPQPEPVAEPRPESVSRRDRGSRPDAASTSGPASPAERARRPDRDADSSRFDALESPTPLTAVFAALVLIGLGGLIATLADYAPALVASAGSVVVLTGLAGLLAIRSGGRPLMAAPLTLAAGVGVVIADQPVLSTGAAVMTCVVGGVYAVVATVPAVTYWEAAREVVIATLVAAVTAIACLGFQPTVSIGRFEVTALLFAVAAALALVHRLGAGLHGLGRRGLAVLGLGLGVLVGAMLYAELLTKYGPSNAVANILAFVDDVEQVIWAFPRPLVVVLGIPALAWGCHMRARRRQGWWACAFGVAATLPVATSLVDPDASLIGAVLRASYSLVLGLALAWVLIRVDLALTGPRGSRARRAEEATAHRPEPSRFSPLS